MSVAGLPFEIAGEVTDPSALRRPCRVPIPRSMAGLVVVFGSLGGVCARERGWTIDRAHERGWTIALGEDVEGSLLRDCA